MHGAAASQVRRAAQRRIAREEALQLIRQLGRYGDAEAITDPGAALLAELSRTTATVAWLERAVAQFDVVDLVEGASRAWLDLLADERQRATKVAEIYARLGLETQRASDARAAGIAMVDSWRSVLDQLDLSASQRAKAVVLVMDRLRAITAGAMENGAING